METLYSYVAPKNKKEFIIIKPGFLKFRNEILDILKAHHIIPVAELRKTLSLEEAKKLYSPHKNEDFYKDLCNYMSEGDSIGFKLVNYAGEDLLEIKKLIRDKYGIDEMRNCMHSSDSSKNVKRESKIYFATPEL